MMTLKTLKTRTHQMDASVSKLLVTMWASLMQEMTPMVSTAVCYIGMETTALRAVTSLKDWQSLTEPVARTAVQAETASLANLNFPSLTTRMAESRSTPSKNHMLLSRPFRIDFDQSWNDKQSTGLTIVTHLLWCAGHALAVFNEGIWNEFAALHFICVRSLLSNVIFFSFAAMVKIKSSLSLPWTWRRLLPACKDGVPQKEVSAGPLMRLLVLDCPPDDHHSLSVFLGKVKWRKDRLVKLNFFHCVILKHEHCAKCLVFDSKSQRKHRGHTCQHATTTWQRVRNFHFFQCKPCTRC